MTTLSHKEKEAIMKDMKSFDEPMPAVGIFWYDPEEHDFFGVYKKELTPKMVEEAAEKWSCGLGGRSFCGLCRSMGTRY